MKRLFDMVTYDNFSKEWTHNFWYEFQKLKRRIISRLVNPSNEELKKEAHELEPRAEVLIQN